MPSAARFAPLGTNTTGIGILTVTNNAWLNGATVMKLDTGNNTNDVLSVGGNVVYGGTLNVTNISATPLAAGQSFKLFPAGTYGGAFSTIVPAKPNNDTGLTVGHEQPDDQRHVEGGVGRGRDVHESDGHHQLQPGGGTL